MNRRTVPQLCNDQGDADLNKMPFLLVDCSFLVLGAGGKGHSQILVSENISLYNLFRGQFGRTY